jgi:cell division protease FtsH
MYHDLFAPRSPSPSQFKGGQEPGGSSGRQPPDPSQRPPTRAEGREAALWWSGFMVLLALSWLVSALLFPRGPSRVEVSYTFFKQQVVADKVASIYAHGDAIQGTLYQEVQYTPDGDNKARTVKQFSTVQPAFADDGLETLLNEHGVVITAASTEDAWNPLLTLLLAFGPVILLIGGMVWLFRRTRGAAAGGIFGIGKGLRSARSHARVLT